MASETTLMGALENIAHRNGFKTGNYSVQFTGEHEYIHVGVEKTVVIKTPDGKSLQLILKLPPTIANDYLLLPSEHKFFNNVHYLTKIHPILKQYGAIPTAPKLHASSLKKNEEFMILEDLEARGFKRISPAVGLNKDELLMAVGTLSTMHMTTRYWKTRNLPEFKSRTTSLKPILDFARLDPGRIAQYQDLMKTIFEAVWVISRPVYGSKFKPVLESVMPNVKRLMEKSVQEMENEPWTTLVNYNLWTTNLLFRYHSITGKPIDVAFVDWSCAKLGSPVFDLAFMAFASSNTSLYPQINDILQEYYTAHMTKEELASHYPIYGKGGVFGALFVNVIEAFGTEMAVSEITVKVLTQDEGLSAIPDIKTRILEIVNTAIEANIL